MNQRGFSPLIIVLSILVLILASAYYLGIHRGYFVSTYQETSKHALRVTETPTPSASFTSNEAVNWTTYQAKVLVSQSDLQKAGLTSMPTMSIKYPSDWNIETTSDGIGYARFKEDGILYSVRFNFGGMGFQDSGLTNIDETKQLGEYTLSQRTIKKDGKTFLLAVEIGKEPLFTNILFDVPQTNQEHYLDIYSQMLSTFKLTN